MPIPPSQTMDYVARRGGKGGSKPGRDNRKPGDVLLLALYRWALSTMPPPGVGEAWFYQRPGDHTKMPGRFTEKAVRPVLPLLAGHFPFQWFEYSNVREERMENIVANRLHKMFYGTDEKAGTRGRGSASTEHPKNWSQIRMNTAMAVLIERGWPY